MVVISTEIIIVRKFEAAPMVKFPIVERSKEINKVFFFPKRSANAPVGISLIILVKSIHDSSNPIPA